MILEVTLVMITFSIITYIALGINSAYKGKTLLKDYFAFGYTWQIVATIICYMMFYPKILKYIDNEWIVSILLNGILLVAIFSYGHYVRQNRLERKYIGFVIVIILLLNALAIIPLTLKWIYPSTLLIAASAVLLIIAGLLYSIRDLRQKNLSFCQLGSGSILFLVAARMRRSQIDYYLVGMSNAALFLVVFGIIVYYIEYTHLKLGDNQERIKSESDKYKKLSEKYNMAMKAVQEGIWEYDYDQDILYISDSMSNIIDAQDGIMTHAFNRILEIIHPDDLSNINKRWPLNRAHFKTLIDRNLNYNAEVEYRLKYIDKEYRWIRQKISIQRDEESGSSRVFGVISIIQEAKEAQEEIYRLAYRDSLTGLKNFTSLRMDLENILQNSNSQKDIRLILLDIDRFQYINDTRGHQFGDCVLAEVAHKLDECNNWVYRIGGTEFLMIQESHFSHESVFDCFAKPIIVNHSEVYLSVSMGILETSIFFDCCNADEVLMKLDLAKHHAKDLGGGCYVYFDEVLLETINYKVKVSEAMRSAILNDEFYMLYQPQLDLLTDKIIGYEALLRWELMGEMVPPNFIIEVAEETGQILALGNHIIEMVFKDLKQIGQDKKVSINLSVLQLDKPEFLADIDYYKEKYNVDPKRICFEITENIWIKSQQEKISVLKLLRERGYKISLDDFGTGYSSYSYIEALPLDELKLDMSFTRKMMRSDQHRQMTINIIQLGKIFNLSIVCEGIETEEELRFLSLNGCDIGQGYYISRPIDISQC